MMGVGAAPDQAQTVASASSEEVRPRVGVCLSQFAGQRWADSFPSTQAIPSSSALGRQRYDHIVRFAATYGQYLPLANGSFAAMNMWVRPVA